MNRKALREFTHKATHFLEIGNENYKQWVFRYTFLELEKDLSFGGDKTTMAVIPEGKRCKARVVAGEDGVFGGRNEAKYFLVEADPRFRPRIKSNFDINFFHEDGEIFKAGDTLLELEGEAHDILAVERILLNLLMRMSGVATFTKKITTLLADSDVLITPTRKTLWGLLDKRAVVIGGGGTHRVNLGDSIMIKDTHMALIDNNLDVLFGRLLACKDDYRFLEIEVSDKESALKVAEQMNKALRNKELQTIGVIMYDNMAAEEIKESIAEMKKKSFYEDLLFEASGGISEKNVKTYAETGVDIISMGSLTTAAKSLNMSLKIS